MGSRLALGLRKHLLRLFVADDVLAIVAGVQHELLELRVDPIFVRISERGLFDHAGGAGVDRLDATPIIRLRLVKADSSGVDATGMLGEGFRGRLGLGRLLHTRRVGL